MVEAKTIKVKVDPKLDQVIQHLKGIQTNVARHLKLSGSGTFRERLNHTMKQDSSIKDKLYSIVYKDDKHTTLKSNKEIQQYIDQNEQPQQTGDSINVKKPKSEYNKSTKGNHEEETKQHSKPKSISQKSTKHEEETKQHSKPKSVGSVEHILLDDHRIQSKVQQLKPLKTQFEKGKITKREYEEQSAELLLNASKSNPSVLAIVKEVLDEIIQKATEPKQNVSDANQYQEIVDTSSQKIHQQPFETKFTKPRQELDGISVENKRVGAILPTDLTSLQDKSMAQGSITQLIDEESKSKISDALSQIQKQHPSSKQIGEKLQSIHSKLTRRDLQLLQQNEVSLNRDKDDEQNVHQQDQLDALQEEHKQGPADLLGDQTYKKIVSDKIDEFDLTDSQRQLAQSVLYDADGLVDNLDMISEFSKGVKGRGIKSEQILGGKYAKLELTDGRKTITAQQILKAMPKIIEYIAKIEGHIDPTNTKLVDYKRTTQIFNTAIVKHETNQFKAKAGQAFMTRACC